MMALLLAGLLLPGRIGGPGSWEWGGVQRAGQGKLSIPSMESQPGASHCCVTLSKFLNFLSFFLQL